MENGTLSDILYIRKRRLSGQYNIGQSTIPSWELQYFCNSNLVNQELYLEQRRTDQCVFYDFKRSNRIVTVWMVCCYQIYIIEYINLQCYNCGIKCRRQRSVWYEASFYSYTNASMLFLQKCSSGLYFPWRFTN